MVPSTDDGQVLVNYEYAGINFIDTYHRSGLYKRDLPFIGGQEGGGTIAAVTPKVRRTCASAFVCVCALTAGACVFVHARAPAG